MMSAYKWEHLVMICSLLRCIVKGYSYVPRTGAHVLFGLYICPRETKTWRFGAGLLYHLTEWVRIGFHVDQLVVSHATVRQYLQGASKANFCYIVEIHWTLCINRSKLSPRISSSGTVSGTLTRKDYKLHKQGIQRYRRDDLWSTVVK